MWYFILMFILGCLLIKNRELAIKTKSIIAIIKMLYWLWLNTIQS